MRLSGKRETVQRCTVFLFLARPFVVKGRARIAMDRCIANTAKAQEVLAYSDRLAIALTLKASLDK